MVLIGVDNDNGLIFNYQNILGERYVTIKAANTAAVAAASTNIFSIQRNSSKACSNLLGLINA